MWSELGGVVDILSLSFEYAHQVLVPQYPDQVGKMYFLVGRKIQMFGMSNEGARNHAIYLVHEKNYVGKGDNSVISFLHDFLKSFPLPISNLQLNCDNCAGQNKNRYVICYLLWVVAKGLFEIDRVELHNICFLDIQNLEWTELSAERRRRLKEPEQRA